MLKLEGKMVKLSKLNHRLILLSAVLIATFISLFFYIFFLKPPSVKEDKVEAPKKVQSETGYIEVPLLGVSEGNLQILATDKGSTKVVKISAKGQKFRLVIFNPKNFEITSDRMAGVGELEGGDKLRLFLKKGAKGFPDNLDKIEKIEAYRPKLVR